MRKQRINRYAAAVGALFALVACRDGSDPSSNPPRIPPQSVALTNGRVPRPLEDDFVRIAQLVPGFGGIFFDGGGNLTVYLVNPADREVTRIALQTVLKESRPFAVRRGEYGFLQLSQWREEVRGALELPGVVLSPFT